MELIKKHRFIFFSIIALIFLFIACLFIVFFNVNPGEIALVKLEESFSKDRICHEKCYLERQNQEKIIVSEFKKNSKKINEMMLNYWQDRNVNQSFKKELIRLSYLAYGVNNPPKYLKDYLLEESADLELVNEIVSQFGQSLSSDLEIKLVDKIKNAQNEIVKVKIIKTLGKINNDSEINNYINLLNSSESREVKMELIKNVSNIREKSTYFTIEQLNNLKNIILDSKTDIHLRQELVLLIGDYYLIFPKESAEIWKAVYKNSLLDSVSRSFSADNLNHLENTNFIMPEVSQEDWANFYDK